MFVINIVAIILSLFCLTLLTYVPFSAIIEFFFFAAPKYPGLYPRGYAYPRLEITALDWCGEEGDIFSLMTLLFGRLVECRM